ncbi:hypothetical protein K469DRAFT_746035 [Zopfia rhizophila CBS 207.26]|uniref:Uncharacterized protein n=1 Tax=Zopfia rhizophila CBS 207.26 TaxID=1314779 RepID=A0A6A6EPG3_9PEZI|nr:hypothetical protein K469DRAFT_746035 [Zopfia rhizophila CBS 207.26]
MMSSSSTFAPHQSSPLARATFPLKDPKTPPCTPRNTARLWDEYEKRAIENAKRRETTFSSTPLRVPESQRFSSGTVLDIIKSYDPYSSPRAPVSSPVSSIAASPQFDFGFSNSSHQKSISDLISSTTVAICKTCKQSIPSASGICGKCKRTIVLDSKSGETTPPLNPSCRNFASTDLLKLHKESASGTTTPTSSSPKRKSQRPTSNQLNELPIHLSSLDPLPPLNPPCSTENPRSRNPSLTDPNEPFLRLQITRKPVPRTHPSSPTTPPSTSHSHTSSPHTRPSSLVNITTPPQDTDYSRHVSATPSELSILYPYISGATTTPPGVSRANYNLQNTMSAWDDWDSDEEEEKVRLVDYWRGRKWRGSRGSLGGTASAGGRRDSAGKEEPGKGEGKKKRGFIRVMSCGCADKE